MNRILLIVFVFNFSMTVNAQQLPQTSSFNLNPEFYNPAAIGMKHDLNIGTFTRKQWTGFDGSPFTTSIFSDYSFKNEKSVIGLMYYYDQLGSFKYNTLRATYNHKFKINNQYTLAGAVSPELTFLTVENNFVGIDPNDPALPPAGVTTNAAFTVGAGLQFYSEDLVIGLSSLQLIESKMKDFGYSLVRHYFLFGSYRFQIGDNFSLTPSFQVKSVITSTQSDFLLSSEIVEKIILGVGYRIQDAIFFQGGFKHPKFTVAYMYDYTTSEIGDYSYGSHEIAFRWKMDRSENKKLNWNPPHQKF